ncbi:MAG TPA: sigma factor, partial [Streptosporangiaceae bacterium]
MTDDTLGVAAVGSAHGEEPVPDVSVLFRQHHGGLVRLAVLLVGDQPTAEDVVQDVFTRLHAK